MQRTQCFRLLLLCALVACLMLACSKDPPVAPDPNRAVAPTAFALVPDDVAAEIVARSGWNPGEMDLAAGKPAPHLVAYQREPLIEDIVHYSFEVRVGSGPYDVIGLHRVVREPEAGKPIKTKSAVFCQHGDLIGFEGVFLFGATTAHMPVDYSFAAFLAKRNVDVWGIDQSWVLVPEGVGDLSFMADWGMAHQAADLATGIAVARAVRIRTGNGLDRMNLLGYSSGVFTSTALLNAETQLPPGKRQVKGFLSVDVSVKSDDPAYRAAWCELGAYYEGILSGGVYGDDLTIFPYAGHLAATAPDDPSPILPGWTNYQTALAFGVYPSPPPDWYHFLAGTFDGDGNPTGLVASRPAVWFDFMQNGAPYEPVRFFVDYCATICDETDVSFDDYMADITVPILDVTSAGGFGGTTLYQWTLTSSDDVHYMIATLVPPLGDPYNEFGHIDLWISDVMPHATMTNVWEPMYQWLDAHSDRGRGDIALERKNN